MRLIENFIVNRKADIGVNQGVGRWYQYVMYYITISRKRVCVCVSVSLNLSIYLLIVRSYPTFLLLCVHTLLFPVNFVLSWQSGPNVHEKSPVGRTQSSVSNLKVPSEHSD